MTSIAVISNHPLGSTASTTTVPVHGNQGRGGKARDHSEFTVCKSEDKTPWTNFHFVMCIGIVGFFIFWIFLLSKMYLPPEFQVRKQVCRALIDRNFYYPKYIFSPLQQIWSLLGLSGSDDGEDGPVSNSTSSVTEEMVFSEEDMSVTVDSVT